MKNKSLFILCLIGSLIVFYLCNRTAELFIQCDGNLAEKINRSCNEIISVIRANPIHIGMDKASLSSGITGAILMWFIYLYNIFGAKNFMRGQEHGSARWGTSKDIKPLMDTTNPDMNIPLSATEKISAGKVKNFEADRNKNIVVVGGSGSGKTFSEIKPSLMQLHSSYVLTDPKGYI